MINSLRYPIIDTLRGFAIVAMIAYHFGFDLNLQGYIVQDINHSIAWQIARTVILGTFILVAGFSLTLATQSTLKHRLARLGRIVVCAFLVSVVSFFMFPDSWIFFGVLHFIVIASLASLALAQKEKLLLPLGFMIVGIGCFVHSSIFDQTLLQWIGMMTYKPITEDYVPIFPWMGVMLIGVYLGKWVIRQKNLLQFNIRLRAPLKPLNWLGRHSLAVYMLHQPLLLGGLWLFGVKFR